MSLEYYDKAKNIYFDCETLMFTIDNYSRNVYNTNIILTKANILQ